MSAVEECEGECWAGWDTWDYWSSVWIEGVILPAIAALGIAGCRHKTLQLCIHFSRMGRPFSIYVHTLFGVVSKQQPQEENLANQIQDNLLNQIKEDKQLMMAFFIDQSLSHSLMILTFELLAVKRGISSVGGVNNPCFLSDIVSWRIKLLFVIAGNILCVFVFSTRNLDLKPAFSNLLKCLSVFDILFLVSEIIFLSPHIEKIQIMLYNFQMCRCFKAWQHYYNECGCKGI